MNSLLKYTEISKKMNVSPCAAFRWLNGERRPSPENCKRLEKITGVPMLAWLFPDEYPNPYIVKK